MRFLRIEGDAQKVRCMISYRPAERSVPLTNDDPRQNVYINLPRHPPVELAVVLVAEHILHSLLVKRILVVLEGDSGHCERKRGGDVGLPPCLTARLYTFRVP